MRSTLNIILKSAFCILLSGILLKAVSQTSGPSSGSLVIVGGAMKDTAIVNRFISLAGGADAPIVLIPTASGEQNINNARAAEVLTSAGARNVTVLHTYDPKVANTEAFVAPLRKARGVWFNGGRQWRFVDAYGGTLTETAIQKVLERGGVIGGSSAGATIQGSYLVRGDTKTNTLVIGDHTRGFAYLKNSAIDQHLLVRNREHDLIGVISKYPELLGIGLDENTAVVIKGDIMEVIGQSYVAIYDHKLWPNGENEKGLIPNGGKYFFLRRGDIYNVRTREVIKWGGDSTRNIF
jgi:cyanophycinase